MNRKHEHPAGTEMSLRLGRARDVRSGHQLTVGRRLSSRAERAATQALGRML